MTKCNAAVPTTPMQEIKHGVTSAPNHAPRLCYGCAPGHGEAVTMLPACAPAEPRSPGTHAHMSEPVAEMHGRARATQMMQVAPLPWVSECSDQSESSMAAQTIMPWIMLQGVNLRPPRKTTKTTPCRTPPSFCSAKPPGPVRDRPKTARPPLMLAGTSDHKKDRKGK